MFSLINWTIWGCERKQKNIWGENMNHVTVCFSLNHPDWLIISLNPKAADTANPLGITLLVGSTNCLTHFNCLLLLYLHYFSLFPWFLVNVSHLCCLENGGGRGGGRTVAVHNAFKSQNWMGLWLKEYLFPCHGNLTSNRQLFQACKMWNFMFSWVKCNFI